MSDGRQRTIAQVRRSRWPGWIWAVPIVAAAIVGWLAIQHFIHSGPEITITFPDAAGMKSGDTKVKYRGIEVGTVDSVDLSKDKSHVVVSVQMKNEVENLLRQGSRFWLVGADVSLSNLSNVKALLSGPYIELDAGTGPATRRFEGMEKPPVHDFGGRGRRYMVRFKGAVGDIEIGSAVKLRGFTIGRVATKQLAYDADRDMLETPVTIELDPAALGIHPSANKDDAGQALDAALNRLIHSGWRAELSRDPPLIGPPTVSLTFDPSAETASLETGGTFPVIPTIPSGGLDALERTAQGALNDVRGMDLPAIAMDLRRTVAHIDGVVSSPRLKDSLDHLDRSLANVESVTRSAKGKVGPTIESVKAAAQAAQSAVASANDVLGGGAGEADRALPGTLAELASAARSIRVLADYLERHPEALIEGKNGQ